jgi:DNA-binding NtrC family response regulator
LLSKASDAGGLPRLVPATGDAVPWELAMAMLLIAESDGLMRWSLQTLLTRAGYTVHAVTSDEAALQAFRTDEYQVAVINDLSGGDFPLLRTMKAQSPKTHVIVTTPSAAPRTERAARDAGAFDFFEKPFDLVALQRAIERAAATPERRKGPRGCCAGCEWQRPCTTETSGLTLPRNDGPMSPISILITDDDKLTRWSLTTLVARLGYGVREAGSGTECLGAIRERQPDVVLLDINLPDTDGITLLSTIRLAYPDLPVLLMTAEPLPESRRQAERLGASAYLQKPIEPAALQDLLSRTLGRRN